MIKTKTQKHHIAFKEVNAKSLKTCKNHLLPVSIAGVMPCVARWFLTVRGGVNDLLFILRRQFDRVRVVEAGNHHVSILSYGVLRVHVVVV